MFEKALLLDCLPIVPVMIMVDMDVRLPVQEKLMNAAGSACLHFSLTLHHVGH